MDVVVAYAFYVGVAALLALGVILAIGGVLHVGRNRTEGFLVYFVAPLVAVIAINTLTSGRNLVQIETMPMLVPPEPGGAAKWLQRSATLFFLAAAVERLLSVAFARGGRADRPVSLMLAFAFCWVGMVALPAAFGTRPALSHEYFYSLFIGLAALTCTERGGWVAIRVTRDALVCFAVAGLVVLAVKRDMVLGPYMGGLIPAFPHRYSGLATGPNAMGPLCVLTLLALHASPFRARWLQWPAVAALLLSLLLTQSKSSWLAGLACWAAVAVVNWRGRPGQWLVDPRQRTKAQVLLVLAILAVTALLVASVGSVGEGKLERFLATRAGADIMTLTGRNEIWAIALDTFRRDPWFGYGPTIWDPYFRMIIGVQAAFHAHNQFINVLAAAGVAGAVGFITYLVVLVRRLLPRLAAYHGFALGLMVLILVRSFSEVPFNLYGFGAESLTQMLLLMLLAGAPASQRRPVHQQRPVPPARERLA